MKKWGHSALYDNTGNLGLQGRNTSIKQNVPIFERGIIRPGPNKQQGFLLVTVVVILAILASVAMLLSTSASMDNAVLARHVETAELDYTAEAALEHAEWKLAQNSSCSAFDVLPSTPFGAHSYSAKVAPTFGSPVTLSATATHSSGALRTLQQSGVKTYQPNTVLTLQPDAAAGKDTYIYQWKSAWNYGTATALRVENSIVGDWSNALLDFDVSAIPTTATIISATLVLNQSSPSITGGDFSVHRVTSPWVEGAMSGGNGSPNWTTRDTSVAWATPGGDYDPMPVATINIPTGLQPHQWEVAALVQSWVSGESDNNGMAIVPASFGSDAFFHSSDATNAALRPSLEITYACECGVGGKPQVQTLQPDAGIGKDAYLTASQERNQGAKISMTLEESGSTRPVLEFDLSWLPPGAMVQSAQLELHAKTVLSNGTAEVHRITTPWIEGTCSGPSCTADGVTWNTTDGTMPWITPGGDYDMSSGVSAAITNADSWVTWDVTSLASDWVNGTYPNYGMLLQPYDGIESDFSSSDASDTTLAPKLTVSFSCPCGMTCTVPPGGGGGAGAKLLFVVGDPANLTTQQQNKKALIEGWGYSVTTIATSESQAAFDAAATGVDVVYIPELGTTPMDELGNKANGLPKGVITEEARRTIQLGSFALFPFVNADSINIVDNTHFITETLPVGSVLLSTAVQSMWVLKPTLALDLHVLGQLNGTEPGLAYVDIGERLNDGSSAPGRRVKLPWGAYDFDVSLFTDDAKTLMQRAIQWAATTGVAPKKVLFVVGSVGGAGMTTEEVEHQALLESWSYIVQVIDDGASQADFDAAVAANEVVFTTNDITASNVGTKLVNAPIGVVTSENNLSDEFGMASAIAWDSGTAIEINDNSHYVTTPFATGLLTVLSSNESLAYVSGTLSADLSKLASSSSGFGVVALAKGASMYGGGSAAGRRFQLPWGGNGFSPSSLNGDGLTILQRALEWGAGAGTDAPPNGYFDGFTNNTCDAGDYAGSDGTFDWSPWAWTEVNESDGPCSGQIQVSTDVLIDDPDSFRMRVIGQGVRIYRTVDLTGFSQPILSFDYRLVDYPLDDFLRLRVSTDGGTTLTEIGRFTGPFDHAAYQLASFDLSSFIDVDTQIQFEFNGVSSTRTSYIDNIHIDEGGGGGSGGGGAVVFESFTESSLGSDGPALSVAKPAGTSSGELLIAVIVTDNQQKPVMSAPAGWTLINHGSQSKQVTMDVFWKIAGASEPVSYEFGWIKDNEAYGWIMRFSGQNATSPIDASANAGGSSNAPVSPAVTTTVPNALILRIGGFDDDDISVGDPGLPGHTAITMGKSGTGTESASGGAGFIIQPAVGNSGTSNFSLSASEEYRAVTIAIAPAP